jgi:hypothetical protein
MHAVELIIWYPRPERLTAATACHVTMVHNPRAYGCVWVFPKHLRTSTLLPTIVGMSWVDHGSCATSTVEVVDA